MDTRSNSAVLTLAVLVVTGLILASVPFVSDQGNGHSVVTSATTSTPGDHGMIYLEATMEDFKSAGYVDGDQILLTFEGKKPIYGMFCKSRESVGYFEAFVAPDDHSDAMTIGQRFGSLGDGYSGTVQISFVKHLDRLDNLKNYLAGKVDLEHSASAQAFCNHREVTVGGIQHGILYRSTDPLGNNMDGKAYYADYFASQAGVDYEINLCETAGEVQKRIDEGKLVSTYCRDLFENGDVLFQKMSPSLFNNTAQFKTCIEYILDHDGSFLIHCIEGKDRTGMFFILLEALCGATMEDVTQDYMQTMMNFYNLVPGTQEYDTVKGMMFDRIIYFIAHPDRFDDRYSINWETVDKSGVDINKAARSYLLNQVGLSQTQLDALVEKLTTVR